MQHGGQELGDRPQGVEPRGCIAAAAWAPFITGGGGAAGRSSAVGEYRRAGGRRGRRCGIVGSAGKPSLRRRAALEGFRKPIALRRECLALLLESRLSVSETSDLFEQQYLYT